MTLPRQHFLFGALSVLAPSGMFVYGGVYLSHEMVAVTCSIISLLAAGIVFVWLLLTFRHFRLRAVTGIISCLIVLWLLIIIPGYVEAKRQRGALPAKTSHRS